MTSALYNFAWVLFHMTSNSKQTSCEEDPLHLLKRKRPLWKVKGTSPFAVHWTAADACARAWRCGVAVAVNLWFWLADEAAVVLVSANFSN